MSLRSVHRVEKTLKTKACSEIGKQLLTSELLVLGAECFLSAVSCISYYEATFLCDAPTYQDAERDVKAQAPSISFTKPPGMYQAGTGRMPSTRQALLVALEATNTNPTDPTCLHGLDIPVHAKYSF